METIVNGKDVFEIVDFVPAGYQIWNIGSHMIDGYLPIVQVGGADGCQVNTKTMKAIKVAEAQTILSAIGRGQNTIDKMEKYIQRYKNSKNISTQRHVKRLEKALEVMYTIKWN